MRRMYRTVLMAGLVALAPVLAGCENFDMDQLDIFHLNEKKKLPGERKEVFPGRRAGRHARHSAGISEGQSTAGRHRTSAGAGWRRCRGAWRQSRSARTGGKDRRDRASARAQAQTEAERKPKPATATQPPKQITVQPVAQGQGQGADQQMAPWPGSAPQQQPAPAQSNDPWLSAPPPPPSTLSR